MALALLIGVSSAVVLTATAGARRTETAFDRALDTARTADVRLQYSSEEPVDDQVLQAVRSHPDVVLATRLFFTLGASERSDHDLTIVSSPDAELFTAIDRLDPVEGRLPDPSRPGEVGLNRFAASTLGLGVGDSFDLTTLSPEQLESEEFGDPAGPRLTLTVVGITRFPDDVADPEFLGIFGTPAFYEATAGRAAAFGPSLEILVHDGADGEAVVQEALGGIGLDEVETTTRGSLRSQVEDATHAQALGLAAFAAAAALATLVATAQALDRQLAEGARDQAALAAVGMTGPQRVWGILLVGLPAIAAGAIAAVALAIAASPLMPIGAARRTEPDPGIHVDLTVLSAGAATLVLCLVALGALSAWRATRVTTARRVTIELTRARSTLVGRALRAGSSAPRSVGVALALHPGAGTTSIPVRSAVVGAVLGTAGVLGALTFAASLDALDHTPERYGWSWTLAPEVAEDDLASLQDIPGLRDAGTLVHRRVIIDDVQLPGIAVEPVTGSPTLTVRRGRMPTTPDEVAVGPLIADRWHLEPGDQVEATTDDGPRALTVVGEVLFPVFDENPFNAGVAVHPDAIEDLAVSDGFERAIVTFDEGISTTEAADRVEAALPESMSVYAFPAPPPDVANLTAVRSVPLALAWFLLLLAVAAVGHAVATTVRRRRHDLATVRALGFLRRQVRLAVGVQSATLLALGVLVGTPLGLALGRVAWRATTVGLGLDPTPEVPVAWFAAIVPVAAVVAALVSAVPGRRATRSTAAGTLRLE